MNFRKRIKEPFRLPVESKKEKTTQELAIVTSSFVASVVASVAAKITWLLRKKGAVCLGYLY